MVHGLGHLSSFVKAKVVTGGADMLKCAGRLRMAEPMHVDIGEKALDMPRGAIGPNDSDGRDV